MSGIVAPDLASGIHAVMKIDENEEFSEENIACISTPRLLPKPGAEKSTRRPRQSNVMQLHEALGIIQKNEDALLQEESEGSASAQVWSPLIAKPRTQVAAQ